MATLFGNHYPPSSIAPFFRPWSSRRHGNCPKCILVLLSNFVAMWSITQGRRMYHQWLPNLLESGSPYFATTESLELGRDYLDTLDYIQCPHEHKSSIEIQMGDVDRNWAKALPFTSGNRETNLPPSNLAHDRSVLAPHLTGRPPTTRILFQGGVSGFSDSPGPATASLSPARAAWILAQYPSPGFSIPASLHHLATATSDTL